jgi:hypothetical protein
MGRSYVRGARYKKETKKMNMLIYSLYKNEYRILKLAEIPIRQGQR